MKNLFIIVSVSTLFISCMDKTKTTARVQEIESGNESILATKTYPEYLEKIFVAHGGLDLWQKQRTLSFTLPKPEVSELHTIDLWSRMDRIDIGTVSMGFDGQTWILDTEKQYKGNPEFYHNLMFYFYAMPFVLADDGINYALTENLEFKGKSYPGIQITYNSDVGTSPKDEYYLHYNPETYKMEWLGYTVTYRTGEDSDNIKWIRYNDWGDFDGLILPNSISWYNYEGRDIIDLRNKVVFENVQLSEKPRSIEFYGKPSNGTYYQKEGSE